MRKLELKKSKNQKSKQAGFTYIEVMCAMVILLVGILGQLSALSFSILRQQEAEQQNTARQIASSTLESIFAARDLGKTAGIESWDMINTKDVNEAGLFVAGWHPVRRSSGSDGIQGTADDGCAAGASCQSDSYTNTSEVLPGFERRILITDIRESDSSVVKKRRLEVRMRYFVGQARREQSVATIIADLPFYK